MFNYIRELNRNKLYNQAVQAFDKFDDVMTDPNKFRLLYNTKIKDISGKINAKKASAKE